MEVTLLFQPRPRGDRIAPGLRAGGARGSVLCGLVMLAVIALLAAAGTARGASGGFERAWGKGVGPTQTSGFEICVDTATCHVGTPGGLGGELYVPADVTADASGNIYVADSFNNRIQKFDSSGNFLRLWGKDVVAGNDVTGYEICTVAANCTAASSGGRGGEFNQPAGVAVDANGNVYVADSSNYRIQKFDASGNFLLTWGRDVNVFGGSGFETCNAAALCLGGDYGGAGGEFASPSDVAIGGDGGVYVVDDLNYRIQKFDTAGNFNLTWGKDVVAAHPGEGFDTCTSASACQSGVSGTLGGEFSGPRSAAVDGSGNVYVFDADRIQKFNLEGSSVSFSLAWGKDVVSGNESAASEICLDRSVCKAATTGGLGGELSGRGGLARDSSGDVYVADQGNERLQKFDGSGHFLRAWGKDVDTGGGTGFEICTAAASCQSGATGGLGGEFYTPYGAATDSAGKLYVSETNRIQVFGEAVDPPPPDGAGGGSQTGGTGGSQTGTGDTQTTDPCNPLRLKLKKAKTKRAKKKIRHKLRALGCERGMFSS
jgi:tripartite motif-containing protein 71